MSTNDGPKKQGQGKPSAYFEKYRQEDGSMPSKACDVCGEVKEYNNSNFIPKKNSSDGTGISTTCRSCTIKVRNAERSPKDTKVINMKRIEGGKKYNGKRKPFDGYTVHPLDDQDAFLKEVGSKVGELHKLSSNKFASKARMDKLRSEINSAVLLKGDKMEGGEQTDQLIAFHAFVEVVKPFLIEFKPFASVHDDIISCLLSPHPSKVLTCSRGVGKSTITTIYVTWLLYRNPWSEQILVTSKTDGHAKKFVAAVRQYVAMSPLLQVIEPDDTQTDNANRVVLKQAVNLGMGQSLAAVSSGGQGGIGSRARVCIADDIETRDHKTPEHVDALEEIVDEYSMISGPFKDSQTLIIGTPWSQYSILGRLSRRADVWEVHRSPVFDEDTMGGKKVYHSRWPEGYPDDKIMEIKAKLTPKQWRLQMCLDLSQTEDKSQPIKLSSLPVIDIDPFAAKAPVEIHSGGERLTDLYRDATDDEQDGWFSVGNTSGENAYWTSTVAVIDPAGALIGSKQDDVGLVIGSSAGPNVVVRFARGIRGHSVQDIMNRVASEIQRLRCDKVIVEESTASTSAWGLQLQNTLSERGYPMTVTSIPTGRVNKFERILNSVLANLASGRVFVCKDVLKGEGGMVFTQQLCGVRDTAKATKLSRDDVVDAFARLLDQFQEFLGSSSGQHVASAKVDRSILARMPLRRNALSEEELEYWAHDTEAEADLRYRLEHLLKVQRDETTHGFEDPNLERRIKSLKDNLAKFEDTFVKRSTLKTLLPQPTPRTEDYRGHHDY